MDKNEKKYDVIMFNMSSFTEWDRGVSNRNFHIVDHLKNNHQINRILAIDYLPHTWKRFFRNWYENIINTPNGKTIKLTPFTRIYQADKKITVYSTIKNKFTVKGALKSINKYTQKEGFENITPENMQLVADALQKMAPMIGAMSLPVLIGLIYEQLKNMGAK